MQIAVIGGGPAGMMAAAAAAANGHKVFLYEQNEKLGKKLYISGKGRCNVTNACDIEDFFENIPRNASFCYSAIYGFTPQMLMELLEGLGLPLKIERGKRVFPESDKSSDVIKALTKYLNQNNVSINLGSRVSDILTSENKITGLKINNQLKQFDACILAMGGASYSSTGSTGKWKEQLEKLGHSVLPFTPSLIPLTSPEEWVIALKGLSLKNVTLKATYNGREIFSELGELLFTHFGISGPMVLSLSSRLHGVEWDKLELAIDLKPALDMKQLDNRLIKDFDKNNNKQLGNALFDLLPQRLVDAVIERAGLSKEKTVHQVSREERSKLCSTLKNLKIKIDGTRPLEEAIITSGGISIKEIDPSTMQSKIIKGLYFAGEMIDVDAYTGGYNLQIAFSTGYLAGNSINQE